MIGNEQNELKLVFCAVFCDTMIVRYCPLAIRRYRYNDVISDNIETSRRNGMLMYLVTVLGEILSPYFFLTSGLRDPPYLQKNTCF